MLDQLIRSHRFSEKLPRARTGTIKEHAWSAFMKPGSLDINHEVMRLTPCSQRILKRIARRHSSAQLGR